VDSYPALEKRLQKSRIFLNESNLRVFLVEVSSLPFTYFDIQAINYTGNRIRMYSRPEVSTFLERYSRRITHLLVFNMCMCQSKEEFQFFQAMTNLKVLEIDRIFKFSDTIYPFMEAESSNNSSSSAIERIPTACLAKLESLRFNYPPTDSFYHLDLLRSCPKLKEFNLHDLILFQGRTSRHEATEAEVRTKQTLVDYLNMRKKDAAAGLELEVDITSSYLDTVFPVDEEGVDHVPVGLTGVEKQLVRIIGDLACEGKLRLHNVPADMIDHLSSNKAAREGLGAEEIDNFFQSVVSTNGLYEGLRYAEMQNLEEIAFHSHADEDGNMFECGFSEERDSFWRMADWRKLRKISGNLQADRFGGLVEYPHPNYPFFDEGAVKDLNAVMEFFFRKKRDNVEEISMEVDSRLRAPLFITPNDFLANFASLKRLKLNIGGFTNEDVKELLSLMPTTIPKLEKLSLWIGFGVRDDTFLGRDEFTNEFYLQGMKCESKFNYRDSYVNFVGSPAHIYCIIVCFRSEAF
jgi:hypothetical protein